MGKIIKNVKVDQDFYLMTVAEKNNASMGQFYMLRSWETYPVLSRPISVFDADEETVSFLYKVVGQGTEIFTKLEEGDEITIDGAHGNGFPELPDKKKIALVGGGVGIAPLYLAAKTYKAQNPDCQVDIYLGFSGEPILVDEYKKVADNVVVNVGGFVTDDIDPLQYDAIVTCGLYSTCLCIYGKPHGLWYWGMSGMYL